MDKRAEEDEGDEGAKEAEGADSPKTRMLPNQT